MKEKTTLYAENQNWKNQNQNWALIGRGSKTSRRRYLNFWKSLANQRSPQGLIFKKIKIKGGAHPIEGFPNASSVPPLYKDRREIERHHRGATFPVGIYSCFKNSVCFRNHVYTCMYVCSSVMQSHPFCTCIWVELVHDVWARSCQAVSMVRLPSVSNLDSCLCTLVIIFCLERLFNGAPRVWAEKIYFVPKILMKQPHDCSY